MTRRGIVLFGSSILFLSLTAFALAADSKPAPGNGEPSWSERFPEIALRIRHLDRRMASADPKARLRVLTELTYFRARDSRVYPPFFRALLDDPSPAIRWEAAHRLWEHDPLLHPEELSKSFTVPLVGDLDAKNAQQIAAFRKAAGAGGAEAGWAIHALSLIGDKESAPLAKALLDSTNVFTRFSAATALVRLGEAKTGREELKQMAAAADPRDPSGYYRMCAAECLYRLGDRDAAENIIVMLETHARDDYADGTAEVLEDLTDQWFPTPQEWRKWWDKQKEKR